jgi:hypothetical protein
VLFRATVASPAEHPPLFAISSVVTKSAVISQQKTRAPAQEQPDGAGASCCAINVINGAALEVVVVSRVKSSAINNLNIAPP